MTTCTNVPRCNPRMCQAKRFPQQYRHLFCRDCCLAVDWSRGYKSFDNIVLCRECTDEEEIEKQELEKIIEGLSVDL